MVVWWGSEVECESALARREREGGVSPEESSAALRRLERLKSAWREVQPVEGVRRIARRLLRVHAIRASDALQLAAAIAASDGDASTLEFVSLDARLVDAARREGFAGL